MKMNTTRHLFWISTITAGLMLGACEFPPRDECGGHDAVLAKSASCAGPIDTNESLAPRDAWTKPAPAAYAFTYAIQCFCAQETVGPFFVTVHGDTVTEVLRRTLEGDTVVVADKLQSYLIDSIWVDAWDRMTPIGNSANWHYHEEYGFMDSLYFDPRGAVADDEYGFTIHDFRSLNE